MSTEGPGRSGGVSTPSRSVGLLIGVPELAVAACDTDGRLLRLRTDRTDHAPVAKSLLAQGPLALTLEVLAASHRVRLTDGATGHVLLTETVACAEPGEATAVGTLPTDHAWADGSWLASFHSAIAFGANAVEAAAADVAVLAGTSHALVGRFPGHPLALTALEAQFRPTIDGSDETDDPFPTVLGWRSWHLYPGSDPHVVTTVTRAILQEERS